MRCKAGMFKTRSLAYDISQAAFSRSFSVFSEEQNPKSVFFKSDGRKMYVIGFQNNTVYEYDLTRDWDVSTATHLQSFAVSTAVTNGTGMFFRPTGLAMYVVGYSDPYVLQYALSSAWDISSATLSRSLNLGSINSTLGVFFRPDGQQMFVVSNRVAQKTVREYYLGTSWDVSTATYSQEFSVAAQEASPFSASFRPDGLSMYVVGSVGEDVNEYRMQSAWDISTAAYFRTFLDSTVRSDSGMFFKPDGLGFFQTSLGLVNEYKIADF